MLCPMTDTMVVSGFLGYKNYSYIKITIEECEFETCLEGDALSNIGLNFIQFKK